MELKLLIRKNNRIKLNKIEAAKRLFKEAVILYFERRDSVAIHHLVHASHEILVKLTGESLFFNEQLIKKEYFKEVLKAHAKSKNFIKHADRDKNDILLFNPELNKFLLFDCACMLAGIEVGFKPCDIYVGWFRLKYPKFFINDLLLKINNELINFDPEDFEAIASFLKL